MELDTGDIVLIVDFIEQATLVSRGKKIIGCAFNREGVEVGGGLLWGEQGV